MIEDCQGNYSNICITQTFKDLKDALEPHPKYT